MMRSVLATLLAVLLVGLAASQSCPVFGGNVCSSEGSCINYSPSEAYCACASGSSGPDCAGAAAGTCTFNSVSATSTNNIPIAVLASYDNDMLTVSVKSPLVTERAYSTIWLDDSVATNSNCTYPGKFWSREFDGCADRFLGVMPWIDTNSCGWVLDSSDLEYFTYNTNMLIQHHDLIDPFAGRADQPPVQRLTQHVIPLQVQFQKSIDVSTNITVQSPVRLLVAVTRQEVASNTQNAIIEVTTNLLYPYKLTAAQLGLTPSNYPGMTFQIVEVGDSALCPNTPGSACTQVFRINIVIAGNCQISGAYGINWNLTCQLDPITGARPASCAIQNGAQASAAISILSEDFCAKVSVKVAISGSLNSFDSASYLVPKSQFIVNQTSFFRAEVESPDATLTSSVVRSVKLVSGAEQILLFSDGSSAIPEAAFQLDQNGANFAEFFFTLRGSYITGIGQDSSKQYSVVARIDVTFTGVPGVKRLVLQGQINKKPMSLNAQIGVVAPLLESGNPNQGLDNGSGLSAPLAWVGAAGLLAATPYLF